MTSIDDPSKPRARLRILMIADFPGDPTLGSPKVNFKLKEEFDRRGHHCDLLFREQLGEFPQSRQLRTLVYPFLVHRAARRAERAHGPYDVVDVTSEGAMVMGTLRRLRARPGPVIVARSNGLEHLNNARLRADEAAGFIRRTPLARLWFPLVAGPMVQIAAQVADAMIVLNSIDRRFVSQWRNDATIHRIPHGVSDCFLDASERARPKRRGALFVGTWTEMKGIHYLAKAFEAVWNAGSTVSLTIVGGRMPEDAIRSYFSGALQQYIVVIDRLTESELIDQYRSAAFLVVSSTYEGFCMVLLEAMSQGLPVITTPVGFAADAIRNEVNGLVVPCRDAEALAKAIIRMDQSAELRSRLATEARNTAQGLTWDATADATLRVYRQLLNRRREARR